MSVRILVDTNVFVDFFARRDDGFEQARKLLLFGAAEDYELWVSSSQVSDLFYILSKGGRVPESSSARRALERLRQNVHVCSVGESQVDAALASAWEDFEDALVCQAAISIGASAIVTRNARDFSQSPIPALDADGFFSWMGETKGLVFEEVTW